MDAQEVMHMTGYSKITALYSRLSVGGDDESGRFFNRSAYSRMIEDVESGKIGVCIMKDLTRWGRDYLQVGNAMEIFRRNNVRFIAVNNGIDSENPDTLEFATLTHILTRQEYCGDVVNFKTTKHFRDMRNHYVDRNQWHITENVHEPIIDRPIQRGTPGSSATVCQREQRRRQAEIMRICS